MGTKMPALGSNTVKLISIFCILFLGFVTGNNADDIIPNQLLDLQEGTFCFFTTSELMFQSNMKRVAPSAKMIGAGKLVDQEIIISSSSTSYSGGGNDDESGTSVWGVGYEVQQSECYAIIDYAKQTYQPAYVAKENVEFLQNTLCECITIDVGLQQNSYPYAGNSGNRPTLNDYIRTMTKLGVPQDYLHNLQNVSPSSGSNSPDSGNTPRDLGTQSNSPLQQMVPLYSSQKKGPLLLDNNSSQLPSDYSTPTPPSSNQKSNGLSLQTLPNLGILPTSYGTLPPPSDYNTSTSPSPPGPSYGTLPPPSDYNTSTSPSPPGPSYGTLSLPPEYNTSTLPLLYGASHPPSGYGASPSPPGPSYGTLSPPPEYNTPTPLSLNGASPPAYSPLPDSSSSDSPNSAQNLPMSLYLANLPPVSDSNSPPNRPVMTGPHPLSSSPQLLTDQASLLPYGSGSPIYPSGMQQYPPNTTNLSPPQYPLFPTKPSVGPPEVDSNALPESTQPNGYYRKQYTSTIPGFSPRPSHNAIASLPPIYQSPTTSFYSVPSKNDIRTLPPLPSKDNNGGSPLSPDQNPCGNGSSSTGGGPSSSGTNCDGTVPLVNPCAASSGSPTSTMSPPSTTDTPSEGTTPPGDGCNPDDDDALAISTSNYSLSKQMTNESTSKITSTDDEGQSEVQIQQQSSNSQLSSTQSQTVVLQT